MAEVKTLAVTYFGKNLTFFQYTNPLDEKNKNVSSFLGLIPREHLLTFWGFFLAGIKSRTLCMLCSVPPHFDALFTCVLFLFFAILGLELRAFTLSHSTSPFL
jgi:hypothetical protein